MIKTNSIEIAIADVFSEAGIPQREYEVEAGPEGERVASVFLKFHPTDSEIQELRWEFIWWGCAVEYIPGATPHCVGELVVWFGRVELANGMTPRTDRDGRVVDIDDHPVQFVAVYAVTRHYGGPEEGGWWWNRRECVSSIPLQHPGDVDEINSVLKFLAGRYENVGDIYSMGGGVQYAIDFDAEHCQHEVLTSGGYC